MTGLDEALGVRLLYSPHDPEPPQHAFLWLNRLEALYGGAAGGGKTDALLMAALQYVDVPGYHALLLRRTYPELEGTLILRAHEWLGDTDAEWNGNLYRYTFPAGAFLTFGYLQTERDRYRYSGWEFQFIGLDELTGFREADYRFLFSRLRRPDAMTSDEPLARVPLRMRGATNPGDVGHEWVRRRFLEKRPASEFDPDDPRFDPADTPARARRRVFIPARLEDNPHVDREAYEEALAALTIVERARLREGDWYADTGDRYYAGAGIDAALAHGRELAAEPPPPAGERIAIGVDWGDHAFYLIGWPLEAGGLWVTAGGPLRALEPGAATNRVIAELDALVHRHADTLGRQDRPRNIRGNILNGNVRADALELVSDVRYDAAGLQSQRTFNAVARRRRPKLKATKIPFANYKRETMLYLRHLLERAAEGHRTRVLAIGPDVDPLFAAQLRNLMRDPKDGELPIKPDDPRHKSDAEEDRDDGPDALVALAAPIARLHRRRK